MAGTNGRMNERGEQGRRKGEWIEGWTDGWPGNPDWVSRADPTETGCQYSIGRRTRFRLFWPLYYSGAHSRPIVFQY